MSTGDPPWEERSGRAGTAGPRLSRWPPGRRTGNSAAVFGHVQVRFAKFRRSKSPSPRRGGTSVTGKKERQRRLARERYLRQENRRARRARRWRISGLIAAAVIVAGGLGVVSFLALGGGSKSAASSATPHPSTAPNATASASATPSQAAEPAQHCAYTPNGKAARDVGTPPARPDFKAAYRA